MRNKGVTGSKAAKKLPFCQKIQKKVWFRAYNYKTIHSFFNYNTFLERRELFKQNTIPHFFFM